VRKSRLNGSGEFQPASFSFDAAARSAKMRSVGGRPLIQAFGKRF